MTHPRLPRDRSGPPAGSSPAGCPSAPRLRAAADPTARSAVGSSPARHLAALAAPLLLALPAACSASAPAPRAAHPEPARDPSLALAAGHRTTRTGAGLARCRTTASALAEIPPCPAADLAGSAPDPAVLRAAPTAARTPASTQDPPTIRTLEDAAALPEDAASATIVASGPQLTKILAEVVRRAPKLQRLSIHHRSSSTLPTRSLELLRRMHHLEHLTLHGDAFLYDAEFAALGRLSQLAPLRLGLP